MDTFQLRCILSNTIKNVHSYVCAIDQLNVIKTNSFCAIVNSEKSFMRGAHWFALYKSAKQNYIDFFCSFGVGYEEYDVELTEFLKNQKCKVRYNKLQCQSNYSSICGMYCIYFLYCRDNGISYKTFLSLFTDNLYYNDQIVTQFMYSLGIPKKMKCVDCSCNQVYDSSTLYKSCCQLSKNCFVK